MVREGYKETELGEIPEEWEIISLGNSCEILDNLRVPLTSSERFGIQGIYPYYGANGVLGYINRYLLDGQFVLLAEDGGYFEEFEDRPIAQLVSGKFWVNNHAHILKPNQNIAIIYLFYSLVHKNITFYIQGGTRSKLNQSELKSIVIFKPPLPEQHRIATVLSTIDDCIEKTEALIAKLKQVKAGLMQDLLTRGIDDEGRIRTESTHEFKDTEIGRVPVEWDLKTLGSITELLTNGFVGTATTYYVESDDGILYIQGYNVKENGFNLYGIKRISREFHQNHPRSTLHEGDLLTIQTGDIGVTTVVPGELSGSNCHALVISRINRSIGVPSFYCQYCNSERGRNRLRSIETGTTMKHLNTGDMEILNLPVPSVVEQNNIASILNAADDRIACEELYREKLLLQKKGLMADLLTGKVRVPESILPSS